MTVLIVSLVLNIHLIVESLVLGILASLIVAVGVELWKKRRKKFHISVNLGSSEIYAPRNKSDVSIKVDYKGQTVDNALVVFYVNILNDGQNDIMFNSHFSDVIHISSKGYKFLSISAEDNRVKPECKLTDNGATLSWEILKKGESIRLCIAAQVEEVRSKIIDRVDCYNNLAFEFRSDCIDAIEPSREMTQQDSIKRGIHNVSVVKYAYLVFLCFFFLLFEMSFSSRYDILYDGQICQNATLIYTPLFKKYILSSDTATTKILDTEDVHNIQSVTPTNPMTVANRITAMLEILIILTFVMSAVYLLLNGLQYSRYKKAKSHN